MTPKEAYEILKKEYPTLVAASCIDFGEFYGFMFVPPGYDYEKEGYIGPYRTVNKSTKEIGAFIVFHNIEVARKAVKLDIRKILEE